MERQIITEVISYRAGLDRIRVEGEHGGSRGIAIIDSDSSTLEAEIRSESDRRKRKRKHKTTDQLVT